MDVHRLTGNYNDTRAPSTTRSTRRTPTAPRSAATRSPTTAAPHTATGTCKGVDGTTVLAGLDKSGTTHTNAGTYNADPWMFTDVTGNYNDTSGTVNDQINKADADCSSISGYTVTYDGSAHTAHRHLQGRRRHDRPGRARPSGTTHTNAGTYNADPWTFTDVTGNYNDTSGTVNDKINKANADCSLDQRLHGHLRRQPPTPRPATCEGVDGRPSGRARPSGTTHTNAGDLQR